MKDKDGNNLEVCSETFLSIFGIGRARVRSIAAHKWVSNNPRPERRGGKREKLGYEDVKEKIKQHISRFRCVSSHYGRDKTPHKEYLPYDPNVKKMYKAFLKEYSGVLNVKYSLYYKIFATCFHLGFGNPKEDVGSTCVKLKTTINATKDMEKKKELITEMLLHKMRAKKFYALLKEEPKDDSVPTICFDLMQNQPLPKSAISEAYYSRQLRQFFLGIPIHKPGTQRREDVSFYTWGEHEQGRGANTVASALTHFIEERLTASGNNVIKTVRLFSDLCVGQNKNYTVLLALNLLATKHKIKFIHHFPVRGHSYMPPDRAFRQVEKILRCHETILQPEDYFTIFNEIGRVLQYGADWKVYDFKAPSDKVVKKQLGFKITKAKVLEVLPPPSKMTIKNFYAAIGCQHSMLKRGIRLQSLQVEERPPASQVKAVKKQDILQLLRAMGQMDVEATMNLYESICGSHGSDNENNDDGSDPNTQVHNEDTW